MYIWKTMNTEDFLESIGVLVSAIFSGLAWLFQIGILQALFTFLTGALVTFLVQSKLQDRSERRKLRVGAIEELHIPLFFEIENIREKFLQNLNTSAMGSWHTLIKKPQMFTLEFKFREQLLDFFGKSQKVSDDLEFIKRIVTDIIYKLVEKELLPLLRKEDLVKIEKEAKNVAIDKSYGQGTGLLLQLRGLHIYKEESPTYCAILKRHPVEYLESMRAFENEQLVLSIKVSCFISGTFHSEDFTIPMVQITSVFNDFWNKATEKIHENSDVRRFNDARMELIPVSNNISKRLRKHIEKYVITEKI